MKTYGERLKKIQWKRIFIAMISPPLSYFIFRMKDIAYMDVYLVNILSAYSFFFNTRNNVKCRMTLQLGAICFLFAYLFQNWIYVACALISCFLHSWFVLYLDNELPLPYSFILNCIVLLIFKFCLNATEIYFTAFYALMVGTEYYYFVEKRFWDCLLGFHAVLTFYAMTKYHTILFLFFSYLMFWYLINVIPYIKIVPLF